MFTSDMAESRQKTVVLQGLDAGMFGEILSYIYSGTLHVSLDKVQPLYQAADLLQLDYVRDTCSSYMAMNVERFTCVDLYKFADVFSVDVVGKACQKCINRNFVEIASSKEFCSLSVNQLTEIISHDELDVKVETPVWEAVVSWVQYNREDRLHHLPSILPHIRFNLLTSDDTAAILKHPLVREDPGSSEVIRNVVQKRNPNLKPRLGMTTEMALVSGLRDKDILFMNPREGKYISCSYGAKELRYVRGMTVTRDNDIYMLDSEVWDYGQLSMLKYNHAENVWEHAGMSPLHISLLNGPGAQNDLNCFNNHLVEVDGILYYIALATTIFSDAFMQMKKYNQNTDQWQECSQLHPSGFEFFSAALVCGPNLYFIRTCGEMHCYDPSQDRWCIKTPPRIIDDVCTAVVMGTEIFCTDFVFTHTMVYDTESDSWQKLQGWRNIGNLAVDNNDPPTLFVLENQLHISIKLFDPAVEEESSGDYLLYVYDRPADAWRDLKATLPDNTRMPHGFGCPVARIYLPYLSARSEDT
ncbi:kelch repeat and BTB domain-containing protein 8-like [Branchiostoma floridae]|uniref:Kelch repeat and BTB domain-containing protein 8-like n=1 Tax=Branchiostoma floridae TaxID=7739 RepID=A0A9J7LT56_BRAFL|nr:kelch repeat and BTB domain-containing protein 8-like [Branchiostoma floridae]